MFIYVLQAGTEPKITGSGTFKILITVNQTFIFRYSKIMYTGTKPINSKDSLTVPDIRIYVYIKYHIVLISLSV